MDCLHFCFTSDSNSKVLSCLKHGHDALQGCEVDSQDQLLPCLNSGSSPDKAAPLRDTSMEHQGRICPRFATWCFGPCSGDQSVHLMAWVG